MQAIARVSVFLWAFLLLIGGCGRPDRAGTTPNSRNIVGGARVGETDPLFRQVADLSVQKGEEWFSCSGTLIARDVILTAAHCLQGQNNPLVIASIGRKSKRSKTVVVHPQFNAAALHDTLSLRAANDLALIQLTLPFGDDCLPAKLPQVETAAGSHLRIAGFGEDELKQTGVLKSGLISVYEYRVSTKDLVAKVGSVGTGFGDSGGPAFVCTTAAPAICTVVGVTSRTINYRQEDIYTSVFQSLDWIQATLKKFGSVTLN